MLLQDFLFFEYNYETIDATADESLINGTIDTFFKITYLYDDLKNNVTICPNRQQ